MKAIVVQDRVCGVRGRGAKGKAPVLSMLKRGGEMYTQVVKNCSMASIMPIINEQIGKETIMYTDGLKTHDGLGYKKHYRIKYSHNEFVQVRNHINGIENFWGLYKVRLSRLEGYTSMPSISTSRNVHLGII